MAQALKWALLPAGIMLAAVVFLTTDPLPVRKEAAPPIENLTVERVRLDERGITAWVRAEGSEPMTIAQVQVDGAYWSFTQSPPGPIARFSRVRIDLPYPWVTGETHHLVFLTNTGVTFEHTIDVALTSPVLTASEMFDLAWLGLFIGLFPVALGMLIYPYLGLLGRQGLDFLLAATVGLLAFLLVDTLEEAFKLAEKAAPGLHAGVLVWLAFAAAFLALFGIGRGTGRPPSGVSLAVFLALGIGVHNFGEGLAVGAALAVGEIALGTFLIVGFMLHNVTEGIGIVAPLSQSRPRLALFASLAALAGLPAVLGVWIGAFASTPHWAALFLAIGAGAILQVMAEVTAYLFRRAQRAERPPLSWPNLAGFGAGLAVMYGTAFFVQV